MSASYVSLDEYNRRVLDSINKQMTVQLRKNQNYETHLMNILQRQMEQDKADQEFKTIKSMYLSDSRVSHAKQRKEVENVHSSRRQQAQQSELVKLDRLKIKVRNHERESQLRHDYKLHLMKLKEDEQIQKLRKVKSVQNVELKQLEKLKADIDPKDLRKTEQLNLILGWQSKLKEYNKLHNDDSVELKERRILNEKKAELESLGKLNEKQEERDKRLKLLKEFQEFETQSTMDLQRHKKYSLLKNLTKKAVNDELKVQDYAQKLNAIPSKLDDVKERRQFTQRLVKQASETKSKAALENLLKLALEDEKNRVLVQQKVEKAAHIQQLQQEKRQWEVEQHRLEEKQKEEIRLENLKQLEKVSEKKKLKFKLKLDQDDRLFQSYRQDQKEFSKIKKQLKDSLVRSNQAMLQKQEEESRRRYQSFQNQMEGSVIISPRSMLSVKQDA